MFVEGRVGSTGPTRAVLTPGWCLLLAHRDGRGFDG